MKKFISTVLALGMAASLAPRGRPAAPGSGIAFFDFYQSS